MKYKGIYNNAPIPFQNLMTSIYGKKLIDKRYGKKYSEHLNFLRENFTKINHYDYQLNALNEFLQFVSQKSPYYKNSMISEILPISYISDIEKINVISKEQLRTGIDEILTAPKNELSSSFTGGTTGKSLNVFNYYDDVQKRMAFLDFFKERHGIFRGMKRASFTGKDIIPLKQKKDIYWRYNHPLKQLLFSSFHLNNKNIAYYISALNKFKPQSLDGFPSSMLILAKYIIRNNITLDFKPIAIFPTAETITDNDREIIEKAFKSKIRNQYASSEGAPFITECPKGNLHLDIMTGVFEKVEKDSDISEIYVTAFETKGTPLVRYKIGDMLEFTDEICTCGYDTPIVKKIIGRSMDYLYSSERGKISSANISNTIKNLPNSIVNIQFIQDEEELIRILVMRDNILFKDEHEKDLINEMVIRLGNSMRFEVKYVEEIPVESSGKYKMIKNNIYHQLEEKGFNK